MTRDKRGVGHRTKVALSTKIPKSWESFLRDDNNKTELFRLLGKSIGGLTVRGTQVCSTVDDGVVLSPASSSTEFLAPCNHKESDTRVFVHVADAVKQGFERIMVRTPDTDVVVLALSCFVKLKKDVKLWVHLKAGVTYHYIPIHEIAAVLGKMHSVKLNETLEGKNTNNLHFYRPR